MIMVNDNDHKEGGENPTWTMSLLSTLVFDFAFARNRAFQLFQLIKIMSTGMSQLLIGERDGQTDHNIAILLGSGKQVKKSILSTFSNRIHAGSLLIGGFCRFQATKTRID